MSERKLYQRSALVPGASDLIYLTRADGSADGSSSFTSLTSVLGGLLDSRFAAASHTHTASQVTDFSTASDARIAAAVGVSVQAHNANLTTYAGITPSANVQTLLGAANYAAFKTSLSLTPGTDVQAYSANLAALAALSTTGKIYYLSAANTWTGVTIGSNLTFTGGTLDAVAGGTGTVTVSGSPTSGYIAKWTSGTDITKGDLSGDISTTGSLVTTIGSLKVATGMIQASAVTLAKIANASASSKLLGSGDSGSGAAYAEITLGTGLTMTGTTLSASAAGGMTLLASSTPSGTGVVTFSSISGSYKELRVVIFGRGTNASTDTAVNVTFNNDTSSIYDQSYVQTPGTGTPTSNASVANANMNMIKIAAASATSNVANTGTINIPGYANTTFQKAGSIDNGIKSGTTTADVFVRAGRFWYRSTTAISRIDLTLAAGNWVAGSEIYLYGIS